MIGPLLQLVAQVFIVGAPEVAFDLDRTRPGDGLGNLGDSGLFTLQLSDGWVRAYSANGITTVLEGPTLDQLQRPPTGPALTPGGSTFEVCGTWLFSAYQEPDGLVRGWYHAESSCDYSQWQSHHSIAYVESGSSGLVFDDFVGAVRGEILTSPAGAQAGKITGNGGGTVLRFGDYFYAYFDDQTIPERWHTGIARSHVTEGGRPGTWKKLYRGSFDEPGLGGYTDAVPDLGGMIAMYNLGPSQILGVGYSTPGGFDVAVSDDALNFTRVSDPLVLSDASEWAHRAAASGELLAYPSLVAEDGGRSLGAKFWLYYSYLAPGEDFDRVRILRRSVEIRPETDPAEPRVWNELMRYESAAGETRTTTGFVGPEFRKTGRVGYVMTRPYPDSVSLKECTSPAGRVATVVGADCPVGHRLLRTIGWTRR